MKTNIKTIFFAALMLLSSNAWADDVTLPAGKYYFDLTGVTANQIQVFNNLTSGVRKNTSTAMSWSDLGFDSSDPLNSGISQSVNCVFTKTGMTYLVLTLAYDMTISNSNNFMQYYDGSTWHGWSVWSSTNLTDLGSHEYLCKVTSGSFAWQTSAPLPSATPKLYYTAGANGSIDTHTAGGSEVSSGAEVTEGTSVHLVANPNDGYSFYGWTLPNGSVVSSMANYVFSMPASTTSLTAVFYSDSTDPGISGCEGCFRVTP